MRTLKFVFLFLPVFFGCQTMPPEEKLFKNTADRFLEELWQVEPEFAIAVGRHEFDRFLPVPDAADLAAKLEFYHKYQRSFKTMSSAKLSPAAKTDLDLLINYVESGLWRLQTFKPHQWNPAEYNVGSSVSLVLEGADKSEEEKLEAILDKLEKVPAYYQAGQANIQRPTKPHTELAIKQNRGLLDYFGGDLLAKAENSKLSAVQKKLFAERIQAGKSAIETYVTWLEEVLKNPRTVGGFRDFRIGPELYREKFELDLQSSFTPEEIYRRALSEKKQVLEKMKPLAEKLWPKYLGKQKKPAKDIEMIRRVIEKVSAKHTKADDFVETIRRQIPQLAEFVAKKELLTLDPEKPLKVRETPRYKRGFAGASVDAPGPFEATRETFYNVTPLDEMTPQEQQSYLREYNDYTLQILNIHEAIPGHYLQLVYANRTPSLVKSVFGNGTMIEGWAVYSERAMLEEGYGDFSPELWLMYYKWFLRVVTNTIIDYEIHNQGLTRKKALHYMMDEAFQERSEAEQKWVRATLSQVQLASYYTGFSEIYIFRESQKEKLGEKFSLKEFHENFLGYGSASIKAIRGLMTENEG